MLYGEVTEPSGVGKNTYQFITGSLSPVTAVLLFRRAPHHADHENADASKAQKRRNRLYGLSLAYAPKTTFMTGPSATTRRRARSASCAARVETLCT